MKGKVERREMKGNEKERWDELLAKQSLDNHTILLSVEEGPEVPKDVGIDILGVVDGSFDLVEGRRVN